MANPTAPNVPENDAKKAKKASNTPSIPTKETDLSDTAKDVSVKYATSGFGLIWLTPPEFEVLKTDYVNELRDRQSTKGYRTPVTTKLNALDHRINQ